MAKDVTFGAPDFAILAILRVKGGVIGVGEADQSEVLRAEVSRVGLCAGCRFKRLIKSDRGSTFYLCQRSATDARFPKYPRLPVLQCVGYEPLAAPDNVVDP